jgi:hypothetical protein
VRYFTYLVLAPALVALAISQHALWAVPLLTGVTVMVLRPLQRLVAQWGRMSYRERLAAAFWVPVIRIAGDIAKMLGYPVGCWWRMKFRPPDWRPSTNVGRI